MKSKSNMNDNDDILFGFRFDGHKFSPAFPTLVPEKVKHTQDFIQCVFDSMDIKHSLNKETTVTNNNHNKTVIISSSETKTETRKENKIIIQSPIIQSPIIQSPIIQSPIIRSDQKITPSSIPNKTRVCENPIIDNNKSFFDLNQQSSELKTSFQITKSKSQSNPLKVVFEDEINSLKHQRKYFSYVRKIDHAFSREDSSPIFLLLQSSMVLYFCYKYITMRDVTRLYAATNGRIKLNIEDYVQRCIDQKNIDDVIIRRVFSRKMYDRSIYLGDKLRDKNYYALRDSLYYQDMYRRVYMRIFINPSRGNNKKEMIYSHFEYVPIPKNKEIEKRGNKNEEIENIELFNISKRTIYLHHAKKMKLYIPDIDTDSRFVEHFQNEYCKSNYRIPETPNQLFNLHKVELRDERDALLLKTKWDNNIKNIVEENKLYKKGKLDKPLSVYMYKKCLISGGGFQRVCVYYANITNTKNVGLNNFGTLYVNLKEVTNPTSNNYYSFDIFY